MAETAVVERFPDVVPRRSPRTLVRVVQLLLAIGAGWVLLLVAFPPGAPDRLPVLSIGVALTLLAAVRPDRALVLFAFVFPCAGLLARAFHGTDTAAWVPILLAAVVAGWCFRFIYDFESAPQPSGGDDLLRALLAVWVLSTIVALARAETIWALLHRLSGRAVNSEGLNESVAVRESVLALASLAGGAVFFFLLRRSSDLLRQRVKTAAIAGVSLSAVAAGLQKVGFLPGETKAIWKATERLSGGAADPNSLGILCALALVVAATGGVGRVTRVPQAAAILVLAVGLMLSGSRSGLLILVVSLVVVAFFGSVRLRRAAIALPLALLFGLALLLVRGARGTVGERLARTVDFSVPLEFRVSARPALWRAAGELFLEHPVEGGGMGSFSWRFPDLVALQNRRLAMRDNPGSGYAQALAETGAVGFLLTAGFALVLGIASIRRARGSGEEGWRASSGVAVVAFLSVLLLGSHWLAPDVCLLFFLLASIAIPAAVSRGRLTSRLRFGSVLLYAAAAAVAVFATARPDETFRYSPRIGFHEREPSAGGHFRWTRRRFALWVRPGESVPLGLAHFTPENRVVELVASSGPHALYRRSFAPGEIAHVVVKAPEARPAAVVFSLSSAFVPKRLGISDDRRELGLQATLAER